MMVQMCVYIRSGKTQMMEFNQCKWSGVVQTSMHHQCLVSTNQGDTNIHVPPNWSLDAVAMYCYFPTRGIKYYMQKMKKVGPWSF